MPKRGFVARLWNGQGGSADVVGLGQFFSVANMEVGKDAAHGSSADPAADKVASFRTYKR